MAEFWNAKMPMQLIVIVLVSMTVVATPGKPKQVCRRTCGDLQIPYPFGTKKGCYKDETFHVTCNNTSSSEDPRAYYSRSSILVLGISLNVEMCISSPVSCDCYNYSGQNNLQEFRSTTFSKFAISNVKNKFTVVGCDTFSDLNNQSYGISASVCSLQCSNTTNVVDGSCSKGGCCQTTFPKGIKAFNITLNSYYNHTYVQNFNPCSYAFLVEDGAYNFTTADLKDLGNKTEFPMVVSWTIENKTCREAMKNTNSYACKENSDCYDSKSGLGYFYKCKDGFEGNLYLNYSNGGCQYEI